MTYRREARRIVIGSNIRVKANRVCDVRDLRSGVSQRLATRLEFERQLTAREKSCGGMVVDRPKRCRKDVEKI
jgi:hypothetical protein